LRLINMSHYLLAEAKSVTGFVREKRRVLHQDPELSGQERATSDYLAAELQQLGLEPRRNVGGGFGVVADIRAGSGPAVALRADMDALPINEETGLPFASRNPGVMHACGHDAHMAMLLGAALLLKNNQRELRRPVRLIFQPAEEHPPGGAAGMIEAGILYGVDSIFALHVWSRLASGVLGTRIGAFMSSVHDIKITIRGKGGHAAMPQECTDPVVVAGHVITALQTVISRSIAMTDSAVVSITRMQAGSATNIVPDTAELEGTIRALDDAVRTCVCTRVREIAEGIAAAHGARADVDVRPGYPTLVNDAHAVERMVTAAHRLGWNESAIQTLPPQGGGEDFAYYAQKVPAAFAFLGAAPDDPATAFPQHHPKFAINEEVLPLGAALLAELALSAAP
jgi:amidohydrolase